MWQLTLVGSATANTSVRPDSITSAGLVRGVRRPLTAAFLAALSVLLLVWTSPDIGLTWDEPTYMEAGTSYASWVTEFASDPAKALSDSAIRAAWDINHEHPPVDKLWSGLVWNAASGVLEDITAHRLGNMLLAGLLVGLVYLMIADDCGDMAGLAAVGAMLTMPRLFFHAHLAALDFPAAAATTAVCYLFWRTCAQSGLRWSIWLGVAYGLASGMKVTALFDIPIVLLLWTVVYQRRIRTVGRLFVMVGVGLLVWLLFWPWLYHDTWQRVIEYIRFMTVDHYVVGQWYRNRFFMPPPWHYPFVITLAVVPLTTTLLAGVGAVAAARRHQALGALLLLGALVPMLLLASGKSQLFDGERLWLPTFPFIAALAGLGFAQLARAIQWAVGRVGRTVWAGPIVATAAVVSLAPQTVAAADLYPHLLSYYSESVGGLIGATQLGLETTYWADTYGQALPYLNTHALPGAMVWVEADDVMLYYQRTGQLRRDLRIASPHGSQGIVKGVEGYAAPFQDADFVVVEYRQSGLDGGLRRLMAERTPAYQVSYRGTPLMEIYEH
jgi:4-amino-4-deoxy-L-arabinose transferase-like glycosyltransferase